MRPSGTAREMPEQPLRLAVLQTDARPRDVTGNVDRLAAMATSYHQLGMLAQERGDYEEIGRAHV